jgi:hypothetical protein
MAGNQKIIGDGDLKEIRHKIRETLQVLQLQYGIVDQAVDSCVKVQRKKDVKECKIAANIAQNEITTLLQTSMRLVEEVRELNDYVTATDSSKWS